MTSEGAAPRHEEPPDGAALTPIFDMLLSESGLTWPSRHPGRPRGGDEQVGWFDPNGNTGDPTT